MLWNGNNIEARAESYQLVIILQRSFVTEKLQYQKFQLPAAGDRCGEGKDIATGFSVLVTKHN